MPVNFKNTPATVHKHPDDTDDAFSAMQKTVHNLFKFPAGTVVRVGMTSTTVERAGVRVSLPFGVAKIQAGAGDAAHPDLIAAIKALGSLAGGSVNLGSPPAVAVPLSPSDMTDEQWIEHTATKIFPGTIHLHQATEMYQPVLGTSGGSIYKTCFIGPQLRVAARIKNGSVSFRATTDQGTCPEGGVKAAFYRLGVVSEHSDRLTSHSHMSGPYDEINAAEYRALFGAFYAALKPWVTSGFPAIGKLTEGVK